MATYEIIVSGYVQDVGFRFYVLELSRLYRWHGNVRNLASGDVKIILQGTQSDLDDLLLEVKHPRHRFMRVDDVRYREIESDKTYSNFNIVK